MINPSLKIYGANTIDHHNCVLIHTRNLLYESVLNGNLSNSNAAFFEFGTYSTVPRAQVVTVSSISLNRQVSLADIISEIALQFEQLHSPTIGCDENQGSIFP